MSRCARVDGLNITYRCKSPSVFLLFLTTVFFLPGCGQAEQTITMFPGIEKTPYSREQAFAEFDRIAHWMCQDKFLMPGVTKEGCDSDVASAQRVCREKMIEILPEKLANKAQAIALTKKYVRCVM